MITKWFVVMCAVARVVSAHAESQKLNVFIWSEYLDPEVVTEFERRFDCGVTIDLYEDNESMMAKLDGGGASLYDIVVPTDYAVTALVKRTLLAPLRHENIPNLKNLDERFRHAPFDPGNQFSVAYQWGTVGLYARKPAAGTLEATWALVFDAKKQPGPFLLIDDMRTCFGAALRYQGHSINSTDPRQLKDARDLLLDAKKRSLGFANAVGGRNRVVSKEARLAVTYSGDAVRGIMDDPDTLYLIPAEGSELWVDNLCIPAQAPHRDLAEKFINFILEPKIGARISDFNQYATPNKPALDLVKPDDRDNPSIYPPPAIMEKLEFLKDLGRDTRLYDELWTQVKAK